MTNPMGEIIWRETEHFFGILNVLAFMAQYASHEWNHEDALAARDTYDQMYPGRLKSGKN